MSDRKVVSIVTLAGEFEKAEMQQQFNSLFLKHKQAVERILELEAEVAHLKEILSATVPVISQPEPGLDNILISDEELITRSQLGRLRERALTQELTFEETKKLEILVKALNLITNKENKKEAIKVTAKPIISDAALISIASQTIEEEK